MRRKGKFNSNHSFKRPYFVAPLTTPDECFHFSSSNKFLKRETNRKVRRMPLDSIPNGCAYKRVIEIWDYNGDLSKLHYYVDWEPEARVTHHIFVKAGRHYFPK